MNTTCRRSRLLGAVLIAVAAGACADTAPPEARVTQSAGELPDGHPPISTSPYLHQEEQSAEGPVAVVLETEDVTDYTYARVQAGDEEIWVAGPRGGPEAGDSISLSGAMGMTDFTSSELGRTFESILFVQAWTAPASLPAANRGELLEVIPAAGYSYMRVATDEGELWLAGPRSPVEPGQVIAWGEGMAMRDFASRSLDRTFDLIYFVNAVQVVE